MLPCPAQAEFSARVQLVEDSERFFPRTYTLPDEHSQLIEYDTAHKPDAWVSGQPIKLAIPTAAAAATVTVTVTETLMHMVRLYTHVYIQVIKPAYGSGGLGLQVVANLSAVTKDQSGLIVQRYIASPLLLDGRKFSVRLYAVRSPPLSSRCCGQSHSSSTVRVLLWHYSDSIPGSNCLACGSHLLYARVVVAWLGLAGTPVNERQAVTSVVPLRVHLYTNGYALLCSADYEHGPAHYDDQTMQFSNAARASLDPTYTTMTEEQEQEEKKGPSELKQGEKVAGMGMDVVGTGQRRTVAWLSQHAKASGVDFNAVWAKMRMAVIHAVLAAEGPLAQGWAQLEQGGMSSPPQRFVLPKILGVRQNDHSLLYPTRGPARL